ncbi:MAG: TonB-dependent receptor [Chlorobium sp.]|nr:MAG: TonB-dependent receptor [Chlorobium sp.]
MNRKVFLVVMAGLLCGKGLLAEEQSRSFLGEELVVTSSRVAEQKKNVTSNISIIDKDEIAQSSAQDLGELLAEKSLGHVQKYPGTSTTVGIRGFRSETHGIDLRGKVLVLLNGRRIGTGNLAKIATGNIERIEIIRGPAAVQYGSAAIGGIINVITTKGKGTPSFFMEQKAGSYDFIKTTAGTSGSAGKLDFSLVVSQSKMGDYKTGNGTKYVNTGYDDEKTGSFNIGYEFLPGNRIGIVYNHFEVGKTGAPSYLSQNDFDDYTVQKNHSLDFIYDGSTADKRLTWMTRYFTGQDKYTFFNPLFSNPDYWDDGIPYSKNVDHKGAQAQLTYNHDVIRTTTGIDWVKYEEVSTPYAPFKSRYDNPAYFLLLKGFLMDERLVLSAGCRYDSYNLMYQRLESSAQQKQGSDSFTKQFGVAWNLKDSMKLRASYGEGFRMPATDELAANFVSPWGTHYVGNAALRPETSKTYEAGIDIACNGLASSFTVFTTDFKDKIQSASIGGNATWVNLGGATISGIEAECSKSLHPFGAEWTLTPYVNYTYLTKYRDESTNALLLYTPEWNATAGLRCLNQRGFNGVFNIAYTGVTQIENYEDNIYPNPVDVITKGGFVVANMTVSKKFTIDESRKNGKGLTISCEVNNLFDRDYQYAKGYPMPGRTVTFGIRGDI